MKCVENNEDKDNVVKKINGIMKILNFKTSNKKYKNI